MTNFARFVRVVEARATRIAGLRASGNALFLAAVTVLGAAVSLYLLPSVGLPIVWQAALLVLPLLASGIAHLLGKMAQQDPARLLLQVDLALGLQERLSSLYELRIRGGRSVFRNHLEATIEELPLDQRKGLPIPGRVRWAFSLGVVCLLGAALFVLLPQRNYTLAAPVVAAPETASQVSQISGQASGAPSDLEIPPPSSLDSGDVAAVVRESPNEQFRLEDVLSELRGTENSSQSIVGDAPPDELGRLIEEQREMAEMMRDFLQSILDRMREEGGGLTDDEQEQIRQQAGQANDPQLVESLMDLLGESNPEGVEDMLESLLSTFDPENPPPDSTDSEGSSQAIPLQEDDPNWNPDVPAGDGSRPDESAQNPEAEPEEAEPGDAEGEAQRQEGLVPGHEENPNMEGGDEAETAESLAQDTEQPDLAREDAPATIGEDGDFASFITEGVPVELPSRLDPDRDAFIVDFERIQSILHTRGVPEDVVDAVRKYFELITQGGP